MKSAAVGGRGDSAEARFDFRSGVDPSAYRVRLPTNIGGRND